MAEFLGGLIAFVAAVAATIFVIWALLAAVLRVFAYVLVVWAVTFAVGIAVGIVLGLVVPPRVLRGRAATEPKIATPDAVIAGKVFARAPRGAAKYHGWDRAWPIYNPHQAKNDANAVVRQARRVIPVPQRWLARQDSAAVLAVLAAAPIAGFVLGAWASILVWYGVMALLGGAVYLVQKAVGLGYRACDVVLRRHRKATMRCSKCYRITLTPTYRCASPACSIVHHDIQPGPLGIIRRRCGCGTSLPATVGAAAAHLTAVCPFCEQDVPKGSGTRRVLMLPVIGAVGAGKTQFLSSAAVALQERATFLRGSLTPISPVAKDFLQNAAGVVALGQGSTPTVWRDRPEGLPLLLSVAGHELEIQLMDSSGESFAFLERAQSLGYIDTADILLFILDPLALPAVTDMLTMTATAAPVPVAVGDQEDSYASVIDRLRAENVRLNSKILAVVVTKVDVLQDLSAAEEIVPGDSDSIRTWLRTHGADGFIRRVDRDFTNVVYFAVDSYGRREGLDLLHPIRVLDWAITSTDRRLAVLPQPLDTPA